MTPIQRMLPALTAVLLLTFASHAAADPGTAKEAAERSAMRITTLLGDPSFKDPATKPAVRKQIEDTILELFDFEEFSSRTVGPSWRRFTPDQKSRFQIAFTDLLRNTYIDTLDSYDGEKIRYVGEVSSDNGARVEVRMEFLGKDKVYPLAFRMLVKNDRWVVYDVIVESISMIKNYRDQFRDILGKGDPELLIRRIEEKAAEQRANPAA